MGGKTLDEFMFKYQGFMSNQSPREKLGLMKLTLGNLIGARRIEGASEEDLSSLLEMLDRVSKMIEVNSDELHSQCMIPLRLRMQRNRPNPSLASWAKERWSKLGKVEDPETE